MVGGLWCRLRQVAPNEMKGHGAKFGRKQEEAIAALLTQRNIDEAAKSIGIAPNTLLKWMKQPEFLTAYREARRDAYRQAIARLQQGTSAAAQLGRRDARTPTASARSGRRGPKGYVMVSRWIAVAEAELWMMNGGTVFTHSVQTQ